MKKTYLSPPHMGGEEIKFVNQAFDTNWIAPLGPNVDGFENDICEFVGSKYAAALASGTSAIHLALIMLGVKQGDEVLTSTFTFSATVNPIIYQQATPVFIDSESDTWNMSPTVLEQAIQERISKGKKPKVILLVHLYGMPANILQILKVAKQYEIPVIEDAAEALGSTFEGKALGTFGEMGIFSFNGNKIITTSGGGALVSNDKKWVDLAIHLATQARDNQPYYQHTNIGYNYRMSNVVAGIGRGQMEVLGEWVKKRRSINLIYKNRLSGLAGIQFLEEPSTQYHSNYWLTTLLVDPKQSDGITAEAIRIALAEHNIESRHLWKPMHLQPIFEQYPYYGDRLSEKLFKQGLCLPSGSSLSEEEQTRIIEIILDTFDK